MGDVGPAVAIAAAQLFDGLDIGDGPSVAYFAEVNIGLARVIHVFTHGGFAIEQTARLWHIEMNLNLLARREFSALNSSSMKRISTVGLNSHILLPLEIKSLANTPMPSLSLLFRYVDTTIILHPVCSA
jgi:hypothetical protein